LRERKEDIPVLADYFLKKYISGTDTNLTRISADAKKILTQYDWPGNVREIKNLIHRCTVMVDSDVLLPEHFEHMLNIRKPGKDNGLSVGQTIEDVERELIYKTLENTRGNKTRAAEILNVTPRTLRNKLSRYKELQSGFGINIEADLDADIDAKSNVTEESFSY
jgi:DNA-binding NtrC family response regulator